MCDQHENQQEQQQDNRSQVARDVFALDGLATRRAATLIAQAYSILAERQNPECRNVAKTLSNLEGVASMVEYTLPLIDEMIARGESFETISAAVQAAADAQGPVEAHKAGESFRQRAAEFSRGVEQRADLHYPDFMYGEEGIQDVPHGRTPEEALEALLASARR